ncbi:unnamed protein product [Nesidiocoris tenuis]|uniref:Uncharacterized protein n=1 Tax=Nesidiocoris tenuis TaxID=355587 RepID=A0A6H5G421_9HEMI|nr:unnamed protein product [Nesidiocoris tenuis]
MLAIFPLGRRTPTSSGVFTIRSGAFHQFKNKSGQFYQVPTCCRTGCFRSQCRQNLQVFLTGREQERRNLTERELISLILWYQIAVLAIVVCVNGNMDDNPGCSKEWIKYLIVNACNYSKRSVIAITYMVEDAMEEMNDKFHKITAPNKLDPMPEAKKISKKKIVDH